MGKETDARPVVYIPPDSPVFVAGGSVPVDHSACQVLGKRDERKREKRKRRHQKDSRRSEKQKDKPAEQDSLTVSPELAAQAERAARLWDMKVYDMTVAATKPEKGGAIWRIRTSAGMRSLKLLHRPPDRSLFSVAAQDYLVRQGARVPPLVRSKEGELYAILDGKMWIVTDWIEGLTQATKVDLEGARALCYGLGEFHRWSRGYEPPAKAYYATRLRRWPSTYAKMRTKIDWFETLARAYREMPASKTLLSMVGHFRQQADDAIARLERSAYARLTERGEPAWGLVHQDFGWSNGQLGPRGLWVIDLDGVAFDLPIRDLRKLITSTMDDRGDWDLTWMKGMVKAYADANPIEPELMEVMLIDMLLPNEFYKLVKEIVFDPMLLNQEMDLLLQRLMQTEALKRKALAALGLRGG